MSVTNALSGLVGVGGLFAMGGGWMPQTFPQLLGALSVLLANLSEYLLSSSLLTLARHLWRFHHHQAYA
jgi:NAD(P) transhydrogenase